jgi:hypothetical protein
MSNERIDPEFREAVVTYSRVPGRERGFTQDQVPAGRREPTLDATEIHVLDGRDDDAALDFGVRSERRVDGDDAVVSAADLGLEAKRSPMTRIVFATAALSIVAGVGVLAATVGIATITPSRAPSATAASVPPSLATLDAKEEAEPSSGIREIPLATEKDAMASVAPKDVAPPVPRARPEAVASAGVVTSPAPAEAKTGPAPAKAELRPSTEPAKPVAILPPPAKGVPTLPPPTPAAQVTPVSVDARGTDALILNIEETLARRDAAITQPQGPLDPHGTAVSPAGEGPVAVLPPPASMAPNYPQVGRTYSGPSSEGPSYDLVPPEPVTGNGYGNTYPAEAHPPGPVPPADVPYGAPPPGASTDGQYGYPSRPMDYEMIPEKKPGFLKRTWMRTADAVKGVFTPGNN